MEDRNQIEEMATAEMIQKYLDNNNIKVSNRLLPLHIADMLFVNNYRKIPENAVVIPEKITEETSPKDIIKIAKYNEKVRNETAREILDEVSKHFGGRWLVELYKKYGLDWDVEVE